ncbi:hypothetical protein [Paludibaculum fermentans]|uniref:hypothetical protein n=1 Tax=Paludibaculum fermentans TaxID=1473598 RepID=UPI003EB81890
MPTPRRKRTNTPSNIALAMDDEPHLTARFERCREQIECTDPALWIRLSGVVELIKKKTGVSINMEPGVLISMLQSERLRYANLHDLIQAQLLEKYPREWHSKRKGIDNIVFGTDGESLVFGALNLGTDGVFSYGPCCVYIHMNMIANVVSFLERNSFVYFSQNGAAVSVHVPPGTRAVRSTVAHLAVVKHIRDMQQLTDVSLKCLARVLLTSQGDKFSDEFIEAQIAKSVKSSMFKSVVVSPRFRYGAAANGPVARSARLDYELLSAYFPNLQINLGDNS